MKLFGKKYNKGGIFPVVLVFMVVISLFGYSLLNIGKISAIETNKSLESMEAFWLSEAGITRGIFMLMDDQATGSYSEDMGKGSYNIDVGVKPGFAHAWFIGSTGIVGDKSRRIAAEIGPIINTIETLGTIDLKGNSSVKGRILQGSEFTFEEIFGITKESLRSRPTTTIYLDPPNNCDPIEDVTFVEFNDDDGELRITNNNWTGSGIMVVEGNLDMTGGRFDGVIWVNGTLSMATGNAVIRGAIFIEGEGETKIGGNVEIDFNTEAIDDVFEEIDTMDHALSLLSWKEE
ncbi:MAG: hypothetical protein ABIG92_06260 [Candidatus Omnitrophota bacterium]